MSYVPFTPDDVPGVEPPITTSTAATSTGTSSPDYDLDDRVHARTPEHFKALGDPTRRTIIDLVLERAATTTELAEALAKPKGTIDHHLKVLERNGFMRVVRTRQVKAMTEKFWGRTARTIVFDSDGDDTTCGNRFLAEAVAETNRMASSTAVDPSAPCYDGGSSGLRHARIPAELARQFSERLDALALEFAAAPRSGDVVFGFVYAVYPTDLPALPTPSEER